MKDICTCTTLKTTVVLAVAGLGLAFAADAMADGARQTGDPLSKMSPAMQQRAQAASPRKVKPTPTIAPGGIAGGPANDDCATPATAVDGDQAFDTTGAVTDGLPDASCLSFGDDNVNQDIWYNYTATATDLLNISLCGSLYDTRVAIYDGCGVCPPTAILACNDDSCGLQSQITGISVTSGNCYTIRVGGYDIATGSGNMNLSFGTPPGPCGNAGHGCCVTGGPGCDDVACCEAVCAADPFCCETAWDTICVGEVATFCAEPCPSVCNPDNPHDCFTTGGPGCNDVECCENVCAADPFCCQVAWDGICVGEAQALCGAPCKAGGQCPDGAVIETEACGDDTNGGCNSVGACDGPFPDCCVATGVPGCSDPACSASVCAADPFCCDTAWDGICAGEACADPNCQCEPGTGEPYQDLACGDTLCGTQWSSTALRDTDWYHFSVAECGTVVTWEVNSEFPSVIFILNGDCPAVLIGQGVGNSCPSVATAELFAGQYTVFVAPAFFVDLPCGSENNDYVGVLTCDGPCPGDIAGPGGGPNGIVDTDDLLKVINNWGACK
jgi:hypothetical protein